MTAPTSSTDIYYSEKQLPFILCPDHYIAIVTGIGFGKTYAGCIRALLASGGVIGGQAVPVPNLGVITAPTYPMVKDTTLRVFLSIAGKAVAKLNKADMSVTMTNGSEILFRSTDAYERLRGLNALWWFGDEAALSPQDAWEIMLGRLRQYGLHGWAWIATSPKGKNWIYKLFTAGLPGYTLFRGRTLDNVFASQAWVSGLYQAYTGDYARQELEGEFISHEGLIYPEFDADVHVHRGVVDVSRFKEIVAGVDWGYNNPTVILVGGIDGDTRANIVHEEYARQRRIEEWVNIAKDLHQQWNISRFVCDPSEPDYIKQFRAAGLNAVPADNRVLPGLQKVRNRLVVRDDGKPRLLLTPNAVNLMAEMDQYEWAKNRDGIRDEPRKAFDHAQDALRYLIMSVDNDQTPPTFGVETRKYA